MLTSSMSKSLNDQLNVELSASHFYLALASYFDSLGLSGFTAHMLRQSQEEAQHARMFFEYISQRDGRVEIRAIEQPPASWESPLDAVKAGLAREQTNTTNFNGIGALCQKDGDHVTGLWLQPLMQDQIEDEASSKELVDKMTIARDSTAALLMIDQELARGGGEG